MYEDGNVQDNTSMAEAAMNNTCDQKIKIATSEQSTGVNGNSNSTETRHRNSSLSMPTVEIDSNS